MTVTKTGPKVVRARSNESRESEPRSPKPALQMLPVSKLVPTPDNRRRPISNASVESLAKSMAREGVLQPVVVRPHPTKRGFFEIRAGERRWRAAKLANLTHLPAMIRTLDDQSALSVTIAENLQRQNLHPLEEAATIQLAFEREYDPKAIASQLGRSVQYIARRASLTRLSKRWQSAILAPDSDASRLSPAHLELIARLPADTQDILCEDDFRVVFGRGMPSVADLRRMLDGAMHSLKAMPWKPDDDTLDPEAGACTMCAKRSGRQPLLFDAEEGGGNGIDASAGNGKLSKFDRCLDPTCYDGKLGAHLARCEQTLRTSQPKLQLVQVTYERLRPGTAKAFGDRVQRTSDPMFIKAKGRINVPVMPVDGPKAGRLMFMQAARDNGGAKPKGKAERPQSPAAIQADRKARLSRRREAHVVRRVESALKELSDTDLSRLASASEGKGASKSAASFDPLALLLAFGTTVRRDRQHDTDAWPNYERLRSQSESGQRAAALKEIVPIWLRRLGGVDGSTAAAQAVDAKRMCAMLGIDFSAMEREAAAAIPAPKSWASHA